MAKNYSSNELTKVEGVELFIIDTLLKKGKIVIPDFGHLELKSFVDRRTVFYKSTEESNNSFLQLMSGITEKEKKDAHALYSIVSVPLKDEKIVNLPQIGIFRPVKLEDDKIHISFIPSAYLRKLLNKKEEIEEVKEVKEVEVKEVVKEEKEVKEERKPNVRESITEVQEVQKDEITKEKISEQKHIGKSEPTEFVKDVNATEQRLKLVSTKKQKTAQVGDLIVPQEDFPEKHKAKNLSGTLLFIVAVIAIILFSVSIYSSIRNKKIDERIEATQQSESISLPSLSELHYGHPAFWIYIYEANSDKLSSPLNIPKNVSLIIPDLENEYDVDITDSLEIKRANINADILLNRLKKNTKLYNK